MNSFEAVLHYGMTRKEAPTAASLREQFFAAVVAGENMGDDYTRLATELMAVYIVAREIEHEDDDQLDLELLDGAEAEKVFHGAYTAAYTSKTGADEVPDGLGMFDFVTYKSVGIAYPKKLMIDAGHLLAYWEVSQQRALTAYVESDEGKSYLKSQGCQVDEGDDDANTTTEAS